MSGRDQISSDGRHLFDGIAFGRPWLRAPRDRPPLALPPRKRARIAYEPDVDDDDESAQLLIGDSTNNARGLSGGHALNSDSDEEDDADFEPEADTPDDPLHQTQGEDDDYEIDPKALGDELRLLKADNGSGDDDDESNFGGLLEPVNAASALESIRLDWSEKLLILRSAFPRASLQAVRDEFLRQEEDLRRTHQVLSEHERPAKSFDEMMDDALCEPEGSHQLMPHPESKPRPLIEEIETEKQPLGSAFTANAIAAKAPSGNAERAGRCPSDSDADSDGPTDQHESYRVMESSSTDTSTSESSSDSVDIPHLQRARISHQPARASAIGGLVIDSVRSVSEDSGGSSEDEGALVDLTNELLGDSSDDSESDSSSDTDSDTSSDGESSDEEPTVGPTAVVKSSLKSAHNRPAGTMKRSSVTSRQVEVENSSSSESDSSDPSSDSSDDSDDAPPMLSTKQPVVKPKEVVTSTKVTPAEGVYTQGLSKTQKRNRRRKLAKQMRAPDGSKTAESPVDSLEARRQALLRTVASEAAPEVTPAETAKPTEGSQAASKPVDESKDKSSPAPGLVTASAESKPKPRMRMDLGAGRRMLFGALGLKNPKTKEDEDKIRSDLLKGVRPIQNPRVEQSGNQKESASDTSSDSTSDSSDSDSDSDSDSNDEQSAAVPWQDKITYRAVECCQEGVTLSEPPFPFVQRWDPQQHYSVVRKRKRDSQGVFDESYVGDESQWYDHQSQQVETDDMHARKKNRNAKQASQQDKDHGAVHILDYDEPQVATANLQESDVDDLPALPSDVTALPSLKNGEAKLGMVITWKEWKLSKATSWSPTLQSVTGLVLSAEPNQPVELLLAMRDRERDERKFDEETGERIFEKFESVDSGDEHEEDDGRRAISFAEMIEPRLVQNAPDIPLKSVDVAPDKAASQAQFEVAPISAQPTSASSTRPAQDEEVTKGQAETPSIPSGQGAGHLADNTPHQLLPSTSGSVVANGTTGRGDDGANDRHNAVSSSEESLRSFIDAPQANDDAEAGAEDLDLDSRKMFQEMASPILDTTNRPPEEHMHPNEERDSAVAPSQRSIASGRQPQSPSGSARVQMLEDDSMIPETGPEEIRLTPARASSVGSADSNPIPSLEEVFHTARMTKQGKAPIKSELTPVGKKRKGAEAGSDPGYLEAMEKLDEGEDSDRQSDMAQPKRTLFPNATQPSFTIDLPSGHDKKDKKTPFIVPNDSQVIDLIDSEPPSPQQPPNGKQNPKNDKASSLSGSARKKTGKVPKRSVETIFHQPSDVESSPAQNTRQRKTSVSATHAKRGRGGGHRGRRRASDRVNEV